MQNDGVIPRNVARGVFLPHIVINIYHNNNDFRKKNNTTSFAYSFA